MDSDNEEENLLRDSNTDPILQSNNPYSFSPVIVEEKKTEISQDDSAINDPIL